MSIETARLAAHLVVSGTIILTVGFIGTVFLTFLRIAFGKKPEKNFTFNVGSSLGGSIANLHSHGARLKPMAKMATIDKIQSWSPILSRSEEETLSVPTFMRQSMSISETQSQLPNLDIEPLQAGSACEDLFARKDIFQLDPA